MRATLARAVHSLRQIASGAVAYACVCALLCVACEVPLPPRSAFDSPDDDADTVDIANGDDAAPDAADAADTADAPDSSPDATADAAQDTAADAVDAGDAADATDAIDAADAADTAADAQDTTDAEDATDTQDVVVDPCAGGCDDKNACTTDTCDAQAGCKHVAVSCSDASACTTDTCDTATGCVFTPLTCNDANACTTDTCDTATGCVFTTVNCDDKSACTTDTCDTGSGCIFTPLTCNDANACTTDSCDPALGCTFLPISCDDSDGCTTDSCAVLTGCAHVPLDASACDDGNACTTDVCVSPGGCTHTNVAPATSCDDNDPCTIGDACQGAQCVPGPLLDADKDGFVAASCGGKDCDDSNAAINPNAVEMCDSGSIDNNCSGGMDETGCSCTTFWMRVASDGGFGCAPAAPVWGNRGGDASGYVTVSGDGTWIDTHAGLQWSPDIGLDLDATTAPQWCLTRTTAGLTDWRQATLVELATLMTPRANDFGFLPLVALTNGTIRAATWVENSARGWNVANGTFSYVQPADKGAALCVRSQTQPTTSPRFVDGSDGQLDTWTGLTWVKDIASGVTSYSGAVAKCAAITTGGHTWRVPTLMEMLSQCNGNAGLPASWSNIPFISDNYWTSDRRPDGARWFVYMGFGSIGASGAGITAYTQCVTGARACGTSIDCDDENVCTTDACDPATHLCAWANGNDGGKCDDGDACTMNEVCGAGSCGSGVPTDADGDGFISASCGGNDCNDGNGDIHPSQGDFCDQNTVDDNCDGVTDGPTCTCKGFYWPVAADVGKMCATDGPIWGERPDSLDLAIVDNGDDTATDSTTQLQWHIASQTPVDFDTATTACLASTLGGKTDWRMPTMTELGTLFDPTQTPLRIAKVFQATTTTGNYWSAWGNNGYNKLVAYSNDNFTAGTGDSARCVRGGPPVKTTTRYVTTADTVYDNFTGVTWQRKPDLNTQHTWDDAVAFCASLTNEGFTWRLPTFGELLGITTFGAGGSAFSNAFPNGLGNGAWTSTVPSDNTADAGYVGLYFGFAGLGQKSSNQLAICVH